MAQLIEFGGTGGVAVLDIGMAGGALNTGSTMDLHEEAANVTTQESAMPQVDFLAVQRTGVHGRQMVARGFLRAASHSQMNTIEDNINDVRSSVPTRLANSVTGRTYEQVILERFTKTGRRFVAATGDTLVQEFEIVFKDLLA